VRGKRKGGELASFPRGRGEKGGGKKKNGPSGKRKEDRFSSDRFLANGTIGRHVRNHLEEGGKKKGLILSCTSDAWERGERRGGNLLASKPLKKGEKKK